MPGWKVWLDEKSYALGKESNRAIFRHFAFFYFVQAPCWPVPVLFHTIRFSISTQFNRQKHFYFKQFSLVKQFLFKQFILV